MCSEYVDYSRFVNEHNWHQQDDFYSLLMTISSFVMNKIFT